MGKPPLPTYETTGLGHWIKGGRRYISEDRMSGYCVVILVSCSLGLKPCISWCLPSARIPVPKSAKQPHSRKVSKVCQLKGSKDGEVAATCIMLMCLFTGAEYITKLKHEKAQMQEEVETLRKTVESLNTDIRWDKRLVTVMCFFTPVPACHVLVPCRCLQFLSSRQCTNNLPVVAAPHSLTYT